MDHTPAGAELAAATAGDDEEAAPLVSAGDGGRRRGAGASASETRDLHLLSSAFLFVFLAYHAAQNLQSTVNTDENLGSMSLGLLYTSFTAFSVVGSPVVRRMGSKRALGLGTSGYLLFIAANLIPSCCTIFKGRWMIVRGDNITSYEMGNMRARGRRGRPDGDVGITCCGWCIGG